jgi:isoquinoline 1-oxidoreductase beta subunit
MTMAQTPPLEVFVLSNGEVPQGVGEEGPPSVIAALANALLKAGGKPVNKLPLRHSGWELLNA